MTTETKSTRDPANLRWWAGEATHDDIQHLTHIHTNALRHAALAQKGGE